MTIAIRLLYWWHGRLGLQPVIQYVRVGWLA